LRAAVGRRDQLFGEKQQDRPGAERQRNALVKLCCDGDPKMLNTLAERLAASADRHPTVLWGYVLSYWVSIYWLIDWLIN
jgi:hypothetical protein